MTVKINEDAHVQSADIAVVIDQYGDFVMTLCMRILGDKMLAEEATQDTFLKVYKRLADFRAESSLKTWIYRIGYRTAIDYARRQKRNASVTDLENRRDLTSVVADEIDVLEKDDRLNWLHQGIAKLPADQAAIIAIFYLEEKNVKELCKITGLTESNIKIKLFRARKSLRDILAKTKDGYRL